MSVWLSLALLAGCAPSPGETRLTVVPVGAAAARVTVRLEGEGAADLRRRLGDEAAQAEVEPFLSLAVKAEGRRVPMLARLEWTEDAAVLVPQASLTPGRSYEALFDGPRLDSGPRLTSDYAAPADDRKSAARITAVYPAGPEMPANLLKLYVYFSRPMTEGKVFRHARLLDAGGRSIAQAFHEQELWDPEHRRLTLLINPGRTKRSLGLSESLGPVLEERRAYTLVIGAGLPDQAGHPLARDFRHPFRTAGFDREQPRIERWRIEPPRAGARAPLVVRFNEPLDHALAARVVRIETGGSPIQGEARLDADGLRWTFTPDSPWQPGPYTLDAGGELEDLAGNSLARPFESAAATERPSAQPPAFRRSFTVAEGVGR